MKYISFQWGPNNLPYNLERSQLGLTVNNAPKMKVLQSK